MPKLTKHQQKVVDRIRELHAAGQPLNIDAVREREPELLAAAYKPKKFWGWLQALEAAGLTYKDIRISLMHQVQCKVCKGWYGCLGSHLKTHDLTSEEYKEMYPGASIMSQKMQSGLTVRYTENNIPAVENWEPLWSREFILDKASFYGRNDYSLAAIKVQEYDINLYKIALVRIGSWDMVLKEIGFNPDDVRLAPVALIPYKTKRDVIRAIVRRHSGGVGLCSCEVSRGGHKDLALLNKARRLFGNWQTALETVGYNYNEIRADMAKYPDRKSLIKAMRERAKRGLPMNRGSMQKGESADNSMVFAILKYYDSFEDAFNAAKLQYVKLAGKRSKYESRQDVLDEIQRRHKVGLPMNNKVLTKGINSGESDKALYMRGMREFASWKNAVEAAGVPYPKKRYDCYMQKFSTPFAVKEYVLSFSHENNCSLFLQTGQLHPKAAKGIRGAIVRCFGSEKQLEKEINENISTEKNPWFDYTVDQLIEELRRRKEQGESLNYDVVKQAVPFMAETVSERVGSWKSAIEKVGVSFKTIKNISFKDLYPTPETVVKAIQRRKANGLSMLTHSFDSGPDRDAMLLSAAEFHFETVGRAVDAAGCRSLGRQELKYPSKEIVVDAIKKRYESGLSLKTAELRKGSQSDYQLWSGAMNLFGGWLAAMKAAGVRLVPKENGPKSRYRTKEDVIAALKLRHEKGCSLKYNQLRIGDYKDHSLAFAARKYFGTVKSAVEAAGLKYSDLKKTRSNHPLSTYNHFALK